MELRLEDLEAAATEDDLAAENAAARTQTVQSFQRKRPSRKPFPDHLPRERVVIAAPDSCPCCGSAKLSRLGEDITETLEVIPGQWKVMQTVREKFSCRECEKITQPPAPFHVTPRGFAGPNLLAIILFEKFGQHQPLNRQSERYRREGIDLSVSTLADQVGAFTKNQVERNAKTSDLIPWSIQEIRRIAQRLARKRIQPADVIAWRSGGALIRPQHRNLISNQTKTTTVMLVKDSGY